MSFQAVSERLSALQVSNNQLKTLITRLSTIKFQPGSVPLDNEEDNVISELAVEIQQTIKDQDEDFELLQEEVLDLDTGRPGSEFEQMQDHLKEGVERAIKELKTLEIAFRKAQIAAKAQLKEAQRNERLLLLQSYSNPPSLSSSPAPGTTAFPPPLSQRKPKADMSKEEREVAASSDVTAALRRTHELMSGELQRSQFAHDTLKESTAALSQLTETYSTLDTLLSTSRNLLGTLLRSQKSDTWYLLTAFYILSAVVAWLVYRRILYYPTSLVLWFLSTPIRMFVKGCVGVFVTVSGVGASTSNVSIASTTVASSSLSAAVTHRSAGSRTKTFTKAPPGVNVGAARKIVPTSMPGQSASMLEQVGRIIDDSEEQDQEPALEQDQEETQKEHQEQKQEQSIKDEL